MKTRVPQVVRKRVPVTSKDRHAKMHVGNSLTSYREGSSEDHGKQSGDDDDLMRPRQAEFCLNCRIRY